jgi:CRP-like cAMP-binding protein
MILEHLNKLSSWDNVLPETKQKIDNNSLLRNFDEETILFRESESISQIYLILYGFVISSKISLNGKEKYLFYLSRDDFVNLCTIDGRTTSIRAKALKGTTLIEIEKDILIDLMREDFNLNLLILHSLTLEVRRCQRQILKESHLNYGNYLRIMVNNKMANIISIFP